VPCTFDATPTTAGSNNYPIVPGSCHPGNLGRNAITGPNFINTDFSVTKDTRIKRPFQLAVPNRDFDLFNHPTSATRS